MPFAYIAQHYACQEGCLCDREHVSVTLTPITPCLCTLLLFTAIHIHRFTKGLFCLKSCHILISHCTTSVIPIPPVYCTPNHSSLGEHYGLNWLVVNLIFSFPPSLPTPLLSASSHEKPHTPWPHKGCREAGSIDAGMYGAWA